MARIFVSYSRKDQEFARHLAADLERLGANVWVDLNDIPAGMKWSTAIQQGLDAAEMMIVVISPDSMASTNVEDEWQYYLDQRKSIVPVLWKPAPKVHFQLSRIQYIDFHRQDYDKAFGQLHTELGRKGAQLDPVSLSDSSAQVPVQVSAQSVSLSAILSKVDEPDSSSKAAVSVTPTPKSAARDDLSPYVKRLELLAPVTPIAESAPRPREGGLISPLRMSRRVVISTLLILILTSVVAVNWFNSRPKLTFPGDGWDAESVAFSPDGKWILTGSVTGKVKLWDAAKASILRTFEGHRGGVESVAFSPDGKWVLTGGRDDTAKLWDAEIERPLQIFVGHKKSVPAPEGFVEGVAFSPDGKYVLTGSLDKTAKLWDAVIGNELRTFSGHTSWVYSVAFSPDGKWVLTGSVDGTAKLWDTATGNELRTFDHDRQVVYGVAFSPDGKYVLTGSSFDVRLWDATTENLIRQFVHGAKSIAFSPDGKYVLAGGGDNTARLWDTATGNLLRTFSEYIFQKEVSSVAFSPDSKYVLVGSSDGNARLWESGLLSR